MPNNYLMKFSDSRGKGANAGSETKLSNLCLLWTFSCPNKHNKHTVCKLLGPPRPGVSNLNELWATAVTAISLEGTFVFK